MTGETVRSNIIPILFFCIVTPLILGGFLSQCATEDTTLIWEIDQNAMVTPIGVDDKNNLILYYLNPSDDGSQTWIMKYSSDGKITYNGTMDFNYGYFHYLNKKIDREGNFFLFGKGLDGISIRKYDQNLDFIRNTTIEIGEEFADFTLSPFFVSEIGSFYLLYNEEYNTLNSTHVSRSDGLYKIDNDGGVEWKTMFECVYYRSRTPPTFISENENSTLYFGYNKNVYRLDSEKGKINRKSVWKSSRVFYDTGTIVAKLKQSERNERVYVKNEFINGINKSEWKEFVSKYLDYLDSTKNSQFLSTICFSFNVNAKGVNEVLNYLNIKKGEEKLIHKPEEISKIWRNLLVLMKESNITFHTESRDRKSVV